MESVMREGVLDFLSANRWSLNLLHKNFDRCTEAALRAFVYTAAVWDLFNNQSAMQVISWNGHLAEWIDISL